MSKDNLFDFMSKNYTWISSLYTILISILIYISDFIYKVRDKKLINIIEKISSPSLSDNITESSSYFNLDDLLSNTKYKFSEKNLIKRLKKLIDKGVIGTYDNDEINKYTIFYIN